MSMTRQDFVAVAHALSAEAAAWEADRNRAATVVVERTARHLADLFEGKYPAFDRERFLLASQAH